MALAGKYCTMKVLQPLVKPQLQTIDIDDIVIHENSMSGDWIDGGTITNVELKAGNIEGKDASLHSILSNKISSPTISSHTLTSHTLKTNDVHAENLFVKGHINSDRLVYKKAQADNFDVKKSVRINLREVLWEDRLGNSVKRSALEEVGILNKLQVSTTLSVDGHRVGVNTTKPEGYFAVDQGGNQIVLDFVDGKAFMGMHSNSSLDIGNGKQQISITADGKVGVGVKRPLQALDVDGNVRFNSTTITSNSHSPKEGNWQKGDVCYNTEPISGNYAGWICLRGGSPGTWSSFGLIV